MSNALTLSQSPELALDYCDQRYIDTMELSAQLADKSVWQSYSASKVGGDYFIGEMKCAGLAGMLAYILKKFW